MRLFLIAAAAVLVCACGKQADGGGHSIAVVNGDFEQPLNGEAIPGWEYSHHAGVDAYKVSLDTDAPAQGKASVKMTRSEPQIYGMLEQVVSVKGYDGKTVRVTAKMKSDGVGPKGWVLFMSGRGLKGNVYSTPMTGTTPWKDVSIEAKVPTGADKLSVGATLLDGGTGWFDDVKISVVD